MGGGVKVIDIIYFCIKPNNTIFQTMKKLFLFMLAAICSYMFCNAQYYNPYQQAYEWGAELARQQQQANQQAYNMGYAMGLVQTGMSNIANGNYETAVENFQEAYDDYDYIPALECLGVCYELGIGCDRDTDWADILYEAGAAKNNWACKSAVQRINQNGHWPASYRSTYLQNFRANYAAQYGGGYVPSYGGGIDSDDVDHSCRACNNTGVCNGCHGTGIAYGTTRCNMCHGSGKCMNCGGKGWH